MPPGSKATPAPDLSTYVPYQPPVGFAGISQLITGQVSPLEFIQRGLTTPGITPAGGVGAVVSKTIIKGGVRGAVLGGAIIGGALLLSGGGQEQTQQAAIDAPIKQSQDTTQLLMPRVHDIIQDLKQRVSSIIESRQEVAVIPTVTPTVTPTYNVSAGGDVDIGGVTTSTITQTDTMTSNITHVHQAPTQAPVGQLTPQISVSIQEAQSTPIIEQIQTATQGVNWILLAAIGIGAYLFLGRKKK